METLSTLSDAELVARLPGLVQAERHAMVDVIEHLVEVERRRLYLAHATSSLYRYCIERLGYSEDAALKRHRVALLALRLPQVLETLRAGTIHLTGLFLLSTHLTESNASALLSKAHGKSRRQLEELIAQSFPRPDVAPSIELLATSQPVLTPRPLEQATLAGTGAQGVPPQGTCLGTGKFAEPGRLEPLSPGRVRVEFTARTELYDKLERARQLLSHAVPSGDLGELFERALDALLEQETRRRFGAGRPRKQRGLKPGSRHVPIEIVRAVWERDGGQCAFVDAEGRRCSERHFLTIEHRQPFAFAGPPTAENLCLLCSAHNAENARAVFGEEHIENSIRARARRTSSRRASSEPRTAVTNELHQSYTAPAQVLSALCNMGFRKPDVAAAVERVCDDQPSLGFELLLRKCLPLLVPRVA